MGTETRTQRYLYILFISLIMIMINYYSYRHYTRLDITSSKLFSLSPRSLKIAASLQNDTHFILNFDPDHELVPYLKNLLEELQATTKKIKVTWLNPYYNQVNVQEFGLQRPPELNTCTLLNKIKKRILKWNELGNYDESLAHLGIEAKFLSFNGEATLASALIDLDEGQTTKVAILNNHGERDPNKKDDQGISKVANLMKKMGFDLTLLNLLRLPKIPEKINILFISQPRMDFKEEELLKIKEWIDEGGRLFLALDPLVSKKEKKMLDFGLTPLLDSLGVELHNSVVVDPSRKIPYSREDNLLIDNYGESSIVKNLYPMPCLFFQARSLSGKPKETWEMSPLLGTSKSGWGETNYGNSNYQFDNNDITGPALIGLSGRSIEGEGKYIIFGDSDFLSNAQIDTPGNHQLLENSFLWLSKKERFLNIPPKTPKQLQLKATQKNIIILFLTGVLALPIFSVLFGFWVKYSRDKRKH